MIIDTESHVLRLGPTYRPAETALTDHYSWHEHSGDLFVAEMNHAGVDRTFLISYDVEDIAWSLEQEGQLQEDFAGGREYTRQQVAKYPERFWWYNTVRNPRKRDAVAQARADFADGAVGLKLFPGYIEMAVNDPELMKVFEVVAENDGRMLVSFENLCPPKSQSVEQYLEQLPDVLSAFPDTNFALLHTGCVDPLSDRINPVLELVKTFPNLYLSTAFPGEIWDDSTEYPFANYQRRMEVLIKSIGSERVMWATDWPWFESEMKYKQAVDCIRLHADYMTEQDKANFLGASALRFMGEQK